MAGRSNPGGQLFLFLQAGSALQQTIDPAAHVRTLPLRFDPRTGRNETALANAAGQGGLPPFLQGASRTDTLGRSLLKCHS